MMLYPNTIFFPKNTSGRRKKEQGDQKRGGEIYNGFLLFEGKAKIKAQEAEDKRIWLHPDAGSVLR